MVSGVTLTAVLVPEPNTHSSTTRQVPIALCPSYALPGTGICPTSTDSVYHATSCVHFRDPARDRRRLISRSLELDVRKQVRLEPFIATKRVPSGYLAGTWLSQCLLPDTKHLIIPR
eukprot:1876239-Rhodomonas_salina.1